MGVGEGRCEMDFFKSGRLRDVGGLYGSIRVFFGFVVRWKMYM